jgi:hypothetical protein
MTQDDGMVVNEKFQQLLKAGKLDEALLLALEQAIELEVTTWVASEEETEAIPGQRLRSRLNLVAGELEHEIGEEFLNNPAYEQLQQFHLEQVQASRQTMVQNVQTLQQLFTVLGQLFPSASAVELNRLSPTSAEDQYE